MDIRVAILLAILTISASRAAGGQEAPAADVGDRVRVTHDCRAGSGVNPTCRETTGTIVAMTSQDLVLDLSGPTLTIPRSDVQDLQVHRGVKSLSSELGIAGTVAGLIVGGIIGANACSNDGCEGFGGGDLTALSVLGHGAVGALAGGLVGALIGAAIRVDDWESVPASPISLRIAPRPGGGWRVGASFGF